MTNEAVNRYNNKYNQTLKDHDELFINKFLIFNKYLYRPLAYPLVRLLSLTGITPNQVTVLAFLVGLTGAVFFVTGRHDYLVAGALLVQLSQLLDLADGMLARLKDKGSQFGAFLDLFLDRVTDFLLLAGITMGVFRATDDIHLLVAGLFATALYFLQVSLFYITKHFLKKEKTGETEELRAVLMVAILVFAVLNRLDILVYCMLLQCLLNVLVRILALFTMKKKIQ